MNENGRVGRAGAIFTLCKHATGREGKGRRKGGRGEVKPCAVALSLLVRPSAAGPRRRRRRRSSQSYCLMYCIEVLCCGLCIFVFCCFVF